MPNHNRSLKSKTELCDMISAKGITYNPQKGYKCQKCEYFAKNIRKLVAHAISYHHPNKSEEWVIENFYNLFTEFDIPVKVKPKTEKQPQPLKAKTTKKKLGKSKGGKIVNQVDKPLSYNLLKKFETGVVEVKRRRNFDYDLDGRVK